MGNIDDKFSERLKLARAKVGLSQKELAEKINMTPASLSGYEVGTKVPSLPVALSLAQTLNVSLDWLCGLIDDESEKKVETYWDICNSIMQIGESLGENDTQLEIDHRYFDNSGIPTDSWGLFFSPEIINSFFSDYQRMRELLKNHTIDNEIFELWKLKQKKQMSLKICNRAHPFFSEKDGWIDRSADVLS